MKAYLKNYRQAPRKVRLVAGLIQGKKVEEAIPMLDFLAKRAGSPIKKLLLSAVANAAQMGIEKENLYIKELRVDKGIVMKRMMPAAMGTGHRINKRTSHVAILLAEKVQPVKKVLRQAQDKKIKPKISTPQAKDKEAVAKPKISKTTKKVKK